VVADALRPDDASGYHPGESVLRMADAVVVNKVNAAPASGVARAIEAVRGLNATAPVVRGTLPVRLDPDEPVRGRRVLVVEDGPTFTHGSMPYGAGYVAATAAGVAAVVDPRPAAPPALREVFAPLVGGRKPIVRARYEFEDVDRPGLGAIVDRWLRDTTAIVPRAVEASPSQPGRDRPGPHLGGELQLVVFAGP